MKKYIVIIFTVLCLLMCSCSTDSVEKGGTDSTNQNSFSAEPPYIYPLRYDSFDDLKKSTSEKNEENIYTSFKEAGVKSSQIDEIEFLVEKLRSQGNAVPYLDEQPIKLRSKEGFSNISLYHSELYELPWIFYHPYVSSGENYYIKMTYLTKSFETQKDLTGSEVIKELAPGSANVDNLGEQHQSIYEQTLKLADREVVALVYEYKTDKRNSFIFVYEDLLVEVRCDPNVWDSKWFSKLSFGDFK